MFGVLVVQFGRILLLAVEFGVEQLNVDHAVNGVLHDTLQVFRTQGFQFKNIVAVSVREALVVGARPLGGHPTTVLLEDGRFIRRDSRPEKPVVFRLCQVESRDGGLTWSQPRELFAASDVHLCEPGAVRSPDRRQLALLLRENSRQLNSHVIFSDDEGRTWSAPRELPAALTGDRHTARYAPDGRLFISFRDTTRQSATQGDWVCWVGAYEDILHGREGQYRVRLTTCFTSWTGIRAIPPC